MNDYGIEAYEMPNGRWSVRNIMRDGIVSFGFIDEPTHSEAIASANNCDIGVVRLRYADGRTVNL